MEVQQRQADQYAQLFRIFRRYSDVIARVSFWDLHDGPSWLNAFPWKRVNHPLLFDRQGHPKPAFAADKAPAVPTTGNITFTDNFDSDKLAFRWIGLRAPTSKWYTTSKLAKALFLEPRPDPFSGQGNPSYLAVRQQNNDFTCTVSLMARPQTANCVAGLAAFQNENRYYAINVKIDSGRFTEISLEQPAGGRGFRRGGGGAQPNILAAEKLPDNLASIDLKIEGAGPRTRVFYKVGNGEFTQLGEDLQSSFLSTDTAGGFQGVTLGMFARK